jgi:hypothetical protein
VLEQAARIVFADCELAPRGLAIGHILDRDQNARPALFVAGQDGPFQLDIEAAAGHRVIDGVAVEFRLAVPELDKFFEMGEQHVVAKDAAEIGDEFFDIRNLEERQGFLVDFDDPQPICAKLDTFEILVEVRA